MDHFKKFQDETGNKITELMCTCVFKIFLLAVYPLFVKVLKPCTKQLTDQLDIQKFQKQPTLSFWQSKITF